MTTRRAVRSLTRFATLITGLTLLGACAVTPPKLSLPRLYTPRPEAPQPVAPPPAPPVVVAPSIKSEGVRAHFAKVQADLLARGLMRRDGGGIDTPFDARTLENNFVKIALYDEYATENGRLVARETPSRLRRWEAPIRVGLRFGASVPDAKRERDRATLTSYVADLAKHTGHPIRVSDQNPNYWVYIVSEDERPQMGETWARLFPGLAASDLVAATDMDLGTFCMVLAISDGNSPVYAGALAVIRAELPDPLTTSCFHEELAQGLGLANDYALARPSIFNDDEEFATLTRQDELMLRILYDRRLRPGMREDEARPIVREIAQRLVGGES